MEYDIDDSLPRLMVTCVKLMRESLNRRFAEAGHDATIEQWILLIHLWQQDGLTQQALADRVARSKVAAFKLLEKLETRGLVTRHPDPADGRCNRVYLTNEGRRMQSALVPLAIENTARMKEGISPEDMDILKSAVKKIICNLKR